MAAAGPIRTVCTMTTITVPLDAARRASRLAHPARRRLRDEKLEQLRGVEALAGCRRPELEALGRVADVMVVPAGTVLAEGWELTRQWWMPIDGWLLAEGDGALARTVPAGSSWAAPRIAPESGRLTALRPSTVLVAPVGRLMGAMADHPRLGTAIRASLAGGDV